MTAFGGIDTCKPHCLHCHFGNTDISLRYVCCAAELKRCEAKVLALQCSVDDLVWYSSMTKRFIFFYSAIFAQVFFVHRMECTPLTWNYRNKSAGTSRNCRKRWAAAGLAEATAATKANCFNKRRNCETSCRCPRSDSSILQACQSWFSHEKERGPARSTWICTGQVLIWIHWQYQ